MAAPGADAGGPGLFAGFPFPLGQTGGFGRAAGGADAAGSAAWLASAALDEYDERGFNRVGVHRETGGRFDLQGYDVFGYDVRGFDADGLHRATRSRLGPDGYDRAGFDAEGYDRAGRDPQGFDRAPRHGDALGSRRLRRARTGRPGHLPVARRARVSPARGARYAPSTVSSRG